MATLESTAQPSGDVTSMVAQIILKIIDADPMKFVLFFLFMLVGFVIYALIKFINAKFITHQATRVVTAVDSVEKKNHEHIEAARLVVKEHKSILSDFRSDIQKDLGKAREEFAQATHKLIGELGQVKTDLSVMQVRIEKLQEGMPTVSQAVEEYGKRVQVVEKNVGLLIEGIRNLKKGAQQ